MRFLREKSPSPRRIESGASCHVIASCRRSLLPVSFFSLSLSRSLLPPFPLPRGSVWRPRLNSTVGTGDASLSTLRKGSHHSFVSSRFKGLGVYVRAYVRACMRAVHRQCESVTESSVAFDSFSSVRHRERSGLGQWSPSSR